MPVTRKLFTDAMGGRDASTYVGNRGEVFYDESTGELRISDGATPGGSVVSGGNGGSTGNLSISGTTITAPQDENLVLATSGMFMGSPPGVQSFGVTLKPNGEFVVPYSITSNSSYFTIDSNQTLRLHANTTIMIGVDSTEDIAIGTLTGPTGNNRVVIQSDKFQILAAAPSSSKGRAGDFAGMIAFDANYLYYCTAPYDTGTTDIWKRVALTGGTW